MPAYRQAGRSWGYFKTKPRGVLCLVTTLEYKQLVMRIVPSAFLHSWRLLGYSGPVVYGVNSDNSEWLSFQESTVHNAWKAAWRAIQKKTGDAIGEPKISEAERLRPTTYEGVRREYATIFIEMSHEELEETALRLLADANRLRRELDDALGIIR